MGSGRARQLAHRTIPWPRVPLVMGHLKEPARVALGVRALLVSLRCAGGSELSLPRQLNGYRGWQGVVPMKLRRCWARPRRQTSEALGDPTAGWHQIRCYTLIAPTARSTYVIVGETPRRLGVINSGIVVPGGHCNRNARESNPAAKMTTCFMPAAVAGEKYSSAGAGTRVDRLEVPGVEW